MKFVIVVCTLEGRSAMAVPIDYIANFCGDGERPPEPGLTGGVTLSVPRDNALRFGIKRLDAGRGDRVVDRRRKMSECADETAKWRWHESWMSLAELTTQGEHP